MKYLLAVQFSLVLLWTNIDQSGGNEHLQAAYRILMDNADEPIGVARLQLANNHGQLIARGSRTQAGITNMCNSLLSSLHVGDLTQNVLACFFSKVTWASYDRALVTNQQVSDHTHIRFLDTAWEMVKVAEHATIERFAFLYRKPGTSEYREFQRQCPDEICCGVPNVDRLRMVPMPWRSQLNR